MKKISEEELEEIEEELAEEFVEKENKKAMPIHSAGLKNIYLKKRKKERNDSYKKR